MKDLKNKIVVGIQKLYDDVIVPEYATLGSACFDVRAYLNCQNIHNIVAYDTSNQKTLIPVKNNQVDIVMGYRYMIPTGIIFHIPENFSLRAHPRSGMALKYGLFLVNCEAVIDSDYKLETFMLLTSMAESVYTLKHGERVCQFELVPTFQAYFEVVDGSQEENESSSSNSKNNTRIGGFGSTGIL